MRTAVIVRPGWRSRSDSGGAIYHVHNSALVATQPTVILTQEQCRICAVTQEDIAEACAQLPAQAKLVTVLARTNWRARKEVP